MSCIENINRYITPNDVINTLMNIYKYIGKNDSYIEITKGSVTKILEQTVQRDAFFLAKILNLDISDSRLRLIITKNSTPRNREESILFNIIEVLNDIQMNYGAYNIRSNDQLNLINYIFQNKNIKYDNKEEGLFKNKSKRLYLDELTEVLYDKNTNIEKITLSLNYFVDVFNIKAFTDQNKTSALITLYILLLKSELQCFLYISFFELVYEKFSDFNGKLFDSSYNWHEGVAQPTPFIRFMVNLILDACEKAEKIIYDYKVDQNISKGDNIEHTINRLPNVFTKEQIRMIHPYVSESTINRALQKLRDEDKIKPLGKGRSAKWRKNNNSNIF